MSNPKWPKSLPPFTEINAGDPEVVFIPEDLDHISSIRDLAHDLYWFDERKYLLYFEYEMGLSESLSKALSINGIEMTKRENFFYCNPKPAYKNDFVRILPHSAIPHFLEGVNEGVMFGRLHLSLTSDYRKQLDFRMAANETSKVLQAQESIVEFKPSVWGITINMKLIYCKIKNWFINLWG